MSAANRYLVSFDARDTFHRFTDVLVIGAGIAGLRAALEIPPDLSVAVVTKDRVTESNSSYAQGGIAGVRTQDDSFENHVTDTLVAGDGLCDRAVVEMVVRDAPAQIDKMIEFGTVFDAEGGPLALTREGWLESWARLRAGEAEEKSRLADLPPFDVINYAGEAKPGATVVARISNGRQEIPAVVAQRFGRGRVAAMMIGDFFQSGLGDETRQKDLGRAWRQLTRWMTADVPDRIEVQPEDAGDVVKLRVFARDEKFEPIDHARVTLAIAPTNSAATPVLMPAEASTSEAGVFESSFFPRVSGGYRVEATVEGDDGKVAGVAQTGWATNLASTEYRDLRPNLAAMEAIAKQTGGRVIRPAELEELAQTLPAERAPIMETWTAPLWHTPWVMLAALACFILEWTLRRRSGLA